MPAGAAAYCRERLIRLKSGLPIADVAMTTDRYQATRLGGASWDARARKRPPRAKIKLNR
jgi:hypothetical protein